MYRPGQQGQQAQQGLRRRQTDQFGQGHTIGTPGSLPMPLKAIIDATGESVTLLQTCDWPGHSPSNIGVDANGKQFVASFSEVTVLDEQVVPNQNAEQLRQRYLQQQTQR